MTGPEFAFEVRPRVLTAYAESLHARAADLASVSESVAAVRVERGWFGRLPESGFLADRYAAHQSGVLAEAGELAAWLAAATLGLAASAGRYSAADRVVAGVAEAVQAALGVGIEIPGTIASDEAVPSTAASGEVTSAEAASGDGTRG